MYLNTQIWIRQAATFNNTLLLGFLFLIMTFFIMPEAEREIARCSNGEIEAVEHFIYSPNDRYDKISSLGAEGRKLYIAVELTADLFYFLVTVFLLCFLLIWSDSFLRKKHFHFNCFYWLPLSVFLINCAENAGVIWLLLIYPEKYLFLSLGVSFFSFLKWILLFACLYIVGKHLFDMTEKKLQDFESWWF